MDCKKFSELLSEFADGELSSAEAAKMKQHMEKCADCKLRYEVIKKMSAEISDICNVPADFEIELPKSTRLKTLYGKYRHSAALIAAAAAIVIFARGIYGGGIKIKDSVPAPSPSPAPVIDATLGTLPSEDAASSAPQTAAEVPKSEKSVPQKSAEPKKSVSKKDTAEKKDNINTDNTPQLSGNDEDLPTAPVPEFYSPAVIPEQSADKENTETAITDSYSVNSVEPTDNTSEAMRASGESCSALLSKSSAPMDIFAAVSDYSMPSQSLFKSDEDYNLLCTRLQKLQSLALSENVSEEELESDFSNLLNDINNALIDE